MANQGVPRHGDACGTAWRRSSRLKSPGGRCTFTRVVQQSTAVAATVPEVAELKKNPQQVRSNREFARACGNPQPSSVAIRSWVMFAYCGKLDGALPKPGGASPFSGPLNQPVGPLNNTLPQNVAGYHFARTNRALAIVRPRGRRHSVLQVIERPNEG